MNGVMFNCIMRIVSPDTLPAISVRVKYSITKLEKKGDGFVTMAWFPLTVTVDPLSKRADSFRRGSRVELGAGVIVAPWMFVELVIPFEAMLMYSVFTIWFDSSVLFAMRVTLYQPFVVYV